MGGLGVAVDAVTRRLGPQVMDDVGNDGSVLSRGDVNERRGRIIKRVVRKEQKRRRGMG